MSDLLTGAAFAHLVSFVLLVFSFYGWTHYYMLKGWASAVQEHVLDTLDRFEDVEFLPSEQINPTLH